MSSDPIVQRYNGLAAHGMTPLDVPFMSEIAPNLWQGGCRNGLIMPRFIKHVVSLYQGQAYQVDHKPDSTLTVRMLDTTDQNTGMIGKIARWAGHCRKTGPVLVHCEAGLNRSSLVTARVLMLDGMTADEAIRLIREKRSPACLCNPAFEEWLRGLDSPAVGTGDDPHAALGLNLLALRKARGWTVRDLSAKSGVSLNSCSRAERGMPVTLAGTVKLAAAFGVTMDALLASGEGQR